MHSPSAIQQTNRTKNAIGQVGRKTQVDLQVQLAAQRKEQTREQKQSTHAVLPYFLHARTMRLLLLFVFLKHKWAN